MSSLKPGFVFGREGVEEDAGSEVSEFAEGGGETVGETNIVEAGFPAEGKPSDAGSVCAERAQVICSVVEGSRAPELPSRPNGPADGDKIVVGLLDRSSLRGCKSGVEVAPPPRSSPPSESHLWSLPG